MTEDTKEFSSKNLATELNSMSAVAKEMRVVNAKDVKYLNDEFGIDNIKAGNLLRKYDLNQAVRFLLNQ